MSAFSVKFKNKSRTDVVGLDLGIMDTKAVRIKRTGDAFVLVAADLLPPLVPPQPDVSEIQQAICVLPKVLQGRYAAISMNTLQTNIRLLAVPGGAEKIEQINFNEVMGISEGMDYRIGYEIIPSDSRAETTFLAAAMPQTQASWAARLLPQGIPAPCSLQAGGVSALNAMSRALMPHHSGEDGVLCVVASDETSGIVAFHKGILVLFRQCPIGSQTLARKVQERFGIETDMVSGVLDGGMIDASATIATTLAPLIRQFLLAREFLERKRMSRVEKILVCGELMGVKHWLTLLGADMGGVRPELWNPFTTLSVASGVLPERIQGMETRFAGAVGAALAVLEGDRGLSH